LTVLVGTMWDLTQATGSILNKGQSQNVGTRISQNYGRKFASFSLNKVTTHLLMIRIVKALAALMAFQESNYTSACADYEKSLQMLQYDGRIRDIVATMQLCSINAMIDYQSVCS